LVSLLSKNDLAPAVEEVERSAPERLAGFAQHLLARQADVGEPVLVLGKISERVTLPLSRHPERQSICEGHEEE
jgi:hypothetical protein